MKRVLTPEAEAERADFDSEFDGGNCSCHLTPPCGSCTHPGNPDNQAEDDSAWMEVDDDYDGVEE
ncbi:hypothetical protein [Frateuria aurantia]|uniref:Uncharacterized protein n=1 Tax=Frateuria aurantia (strain ATCC 33424 / DSM 6220 / KCTC 2777 / LMG 1558 / NBRC 3245 / NCIMB 13370) TaxID=767434 RepID=H8L636_FRAAD|nr:hypothetical protein [Frateuria aurantia]AFC85880.1 hypothetical protein Fraau_1457 [Frateuria aurantia DSM 6220]